MKTAAFSWPDQECTSIPTIVCSSAYRPNASTTHYSNMNQQQHFSRSMFDNDGPTSGGT